MSEFLFLYRSDLEQRKKAMGTPEAAQRSMEAWMAWMRDLDAKGHLKDPGQPLDQAGKVVRGSKQLVTDGPFAEVKDLVLGFTVVKARDLGQAAELAKGCPILRGEGTVEVRPVVDMTPPR
jgi:hypothetical protein